MAPPAAPGPVEAAFLADYLAKPTYLLSCDEKAGLDPALARIVLAQAGRWLSERKAGLVADFDREGPGGAALAERWRAETAASLPLGLFAAAEKGADLYLELSFAVSGEEKPGKNSASARLGVKIYQVSPPVLLGSLDFVGQPAFSPSSYPAAVANALSWALWAAMPEVAARARELLSAGLQRGLRFELLLEGRLDPRPRAALLAALSARIREAAVLASPAGTRIELRAFATRAELEKAIVEAAAEAGLAGYRLERRGGWGYALVRGG